MGLRIATPSEDWRNYCDDPDRLDPCVCGEGCEIQNSDEGWPQGAVCFDGTDAA